MGPRQRQASLRPDTCIRSYRYAALCHASHVLLAQPRLCCPQPVLTEPFSGYDLFEVALFLRFIFRPIVLTPDNLVAVRGSLLGLLRLAHQLDVPQLVEAVLKEMSSELQCLLQAVNRVPPQPDCRQYAVQWRC